LALARWRGTIAEVTEITGAHGGPALCSIHADEVVPVAEDEAAFGDD